jgi:8-oxo-dGTP pyrophosphatase MutT (NUDIX family)
MIPESDPFAGLRRRLHVHSPRRITTKAESRASVALVLAGTRLQDLEILLMERIKHPQDPWSGHVSLPGGRWKAEDRNQLATSIRETEEETGVSLRPKHLLGGLDDLSPRTATYPELVVRPFVFGLRQKPPLDPGPEAEECFWVRLDALPGAIREETFFIAGKPRKLPAFKIGTRTVWGITYRILETLLEILPE